MGAGTAVLVKKSIVELDPGDVAFHALGLSGLVIVIVAGWTTANANLYRAGLAAQAIFSNQSRTRTTFLVGIVTVIIACFPFVFTKLLPLLTYAGLLVVPVGAIVFAEHFLFPKLGLTRYWVTYKQLQHSSAAVLSWALGLVFGFTLNAIDIMPFYYLFIPTWIFSIIVYIQLAKRYGAADSYPEQEAELAAFDTRVKEFHAEQAAKEPHFAIDQRGFTKLLSTLAWLSLGVTIALATNTMFFSPDISSYEANRTLFLTLDLPAQLSILLQLTGRCIVETIFSQQV